MPITELYSFTLACIAALAAGLVGSFALMKRMTLAGDAMSHIALPGLGIAILLGANPIVGGAAALLVGAFLVANLEQRAGLAVETAVGVIFSAALAVGALITPSEDLIEALFGGFKPISHIEFFVYASIALVVVSFISRYKNQLILGLFSPDLAASIGVNLQRLNLYYLIAFALTLVLGLRFLGALLVGALIIIPAATGKQLAHRLQNFLLLSSLASVFSVLIGIWISSAYHLALGPTVVTVAAALFLVSLLKKKR